MIVYSADKILEGVDRWIPFNGQITSDFGSSGYIRIRIVANGNVQSEATFGYGVYQGIVSLSPIMTFQGEGSCSVSLGANNVIIVNALPNYGVMFYYCRVW